MLKGILKILFTIVPIVLLNIPTIAQTHYPLMTIEPSNRLTIYFNKLPVDYQSFLKPSKTLISITVYGIEGKLKEDSIISNGIISKATIKKFANHLEINIYLKSPRGYTITPLEYSNSLMVEVFDWNVLSPAEENYRMGLLSFTSNLAVARKYFERAFGEDNANSGYFLGLLYLKANEVEKAKRILQKAESLGCNIPDLFSALAQVFDMKNEKELAEDYRKKFYTHQPYAKYHPIPVAPEIRDSIFKEVSELITEEKNTSQINENTSKDTTAPKPVIISEKEIQPKQVGLSIFERILIFLGTSILLLSILLTSLYLKWRKEKKLREVKRKFENELLKQKYSASSTLAARLYKKSEESTKEQIENRPTQTSSPNAINPEIKELAEKILSSKKQEKEEEFPNKQEIPIIKQTKIPLRIEKALQIQKEQIELLKKKISKLEDIGASEQKEKLEEIAKNFGINKSSILARKNIEAIEKNKDFTEKLFNKFFRKTKD